MSYRYEMLFISLQVTALETAGSGTTCNAICPGWVLTPRESEQQQKHQHVTIASATSKTAKTIGSKGNSINL